MNLILIDKSYCVKDYQPMDLEWYSGDEKLQSKTSAKPMGSYSQLTLPAQKIENSGQKYSCKAQELQFQETVQIFVNGEQEFESAETV